MKRNSGRAVRRAFQDIVRRDRFDFRVAMKVGRVEGQDSWNPVDEHRRDESGVVGVFADNLILRDELFPDRPDGGRVVMNWELRLEFRQL